MICVSPLCLIDQRARDSVAYEETENSDSYDAG